MRFHSKIHNKNHHTNPTTGYPDSASDSIASHDSPFKGDFVIDGSIYADTLSLSDSISSLEVDSLVVNNPLYSLSVETLTLTSFGSNTDGSNLINVNATTLDGLDSLAFEVVSDKNINGGYLGIAGNGDAGFNLTNLTLSSLNFIEVNRYLTEYDLSATVAPLITSDNTYGREIPNDFLPISLQQNILGISTTQLLNRGDATHYSLLSSGLTLTIWDSPQTSDMVTFLNYSGGSNELSSNDEFKSDSLSTYPSVTIVNNEVLKFIFDGTNWLLTT